MSTQSIRSIITNQVSLAISRGRDQIEEEGRKKMDELKDEIPSGPEEIVENLKADINLNTCSKKGKDKFDQKVNNELNKLQQIEKPLILSQKKITRINDNLSDIINEKGAVGVINTLSDALKPISEALKYVISVSPIALASQMSLPGTGGPVNGLIIAQLIDKIDFGKAKIREISGLISSIPNMLTFYKNQAQEVVDKTQILNAKVQELLDTINKYKLIILTLKLQFEKNCTDEMSSGNTGTSNTGDPGNTTGINSNNFQSPSIDDIKEIAETLYGNILDDLINKGNTKAVERIYTITKELTEGYNISFKVIKI
jgi:hypothetical protein|tara:strand:- start:41 stop:982 length:942 start_codon:yes stop_codon:yes gene_type:complete